MAVPGAQDTKGRRRSALSAARTANASAYELRGAAMLARQELEKAVQRTVNSRSCLPQEPTFYANLGLIESNLKRFPEADNICGKQLKWPRFRAELHQPGKFLSPTAATT